MFLEINVVHYIHEVLDKYIKPGMTLVDATVGNGEDTVFLAEHLSGKGKIYGFDIQPKALEITKGKISFYEGISVNLILDSHENLASYVFEPVDVIVFNLGYLPKGNKTIITKANSTKKAIEQGLYSLRDGGIMTIAHYTGHEGSFEEGKKIYDYLSEISNKLINIHHITFPNHHNNPPSIYLIEKRKNQ